MTSRWQWVLRLIVRRIWFRAALFSVMSVVLALLAAWIAPIIPYDISTKIGSHAVDNILEILASSMLAVTTFSLTAMVSAYSGAAGAISPRATELLVRDSTAQNALSTFLGAFLFAIVGICALSTGLYGETGRVVLFAGSLAVTAAVALTLLRWIEHLSRFGRVADTIRRVERVASKAVAGLNRKVCLRSGAEATCLPGGEATEVYATSIGYVTHVDVGAIARQAAQSGRPVHVLVGPGAFVTPSRPLAWLEGGQAEPSEPLTDAFTVGPEREFDQDPRFGIVVLAEIASRALSPGINDPGTAIAVLGAGVRVLNLLVARAEAEHEPTEGVHLPPLLLDDVLEDLFRPIARDGAGVVEVALKLQRSLGELAALQPSASAALRLQASDALARSERAMQNEADLDEVRQLYRAFWLAGRPDEAARS